MKLFREYFRTVTISFEFLLILLSFCAIYYFPDIVQNFALKITAKEEIVKYLTLIPMALFAWTINEAKYLLFPSEQLEKIIQDWPDYWRLRIHFIVSLFYSLLFSIIGLLVWIFGWNVNEKKGFMLLLLSVCGSFIVVTSIYLARIRQKEILIKLDQFEK